MEVFVYVYEWRQNVNTWLIILKCGVSTGQTKKCSYYFREKHDWGRWPVYVGQFSDIHHCWWVSISALMFKMLCDRPVPPPVTGSCSSHSYVMVTIFSVNFYIIVFIGKFCSSYSQHAYNAHEHKLLTKWAVYIKRLYIKNGNSRKRCHSHRMFTLVATILCTHGPGFPLTSNKMVSNTNKVYK